MRQSDGERSRKTKARLLDELEALDRRVQELEAANAGADSGDVSEKSDDSREADDLQTILGSLDHGVTLFDANLELVAWNEQWLKLAQFPRELARPKTPLIDMIAYNARRGILGDDDPGEDARAQLAAYRAMATETDSAGKRFERRYPDGTVTEIRADRTPGGGLVITHTDITELKRREHEIQALNHDLEQRVQARTQELSEKTALLEATFESISEGFALFDAEDRLVFCNENYRRFSGSLNDLMEPGVSFESLVRAALERGVLDYGGDTTEAKIQARLARHRAPAGNIELQLKDGRWLLVSERKTADGGIAAVMTEITDMKRSEQVLVESQRRTSLLMNSVPALIAYVDREKRFQFTNVGYERMFGMTEEQLRGSLVSDLLGESAFRVAEPNLDRALSGELTEYENVIRGGGGEQVHIRVSYVPDVDENGAVEGLFALVIDETEHKQAERDLAKELAQRIAAEEALRHSEARMRSVIDNTVDGIIVINEHGIIESFSRRATEIFGYAAEEVIGQNVRVLMPEPDRSRHGEYIGRYQSTGEARIIGIGREVTGQRKDGSTFPMDLGISDVDLGDHHLFCGVVRDITRRKEAERELTEKTALLEATFEGISEGFALFDSHDRLVFCNEIYVRFAQPIADLIKPGVTYETLLRATVESGHAAHPGDTVEAKIQMRMAKHRNPHGNHQVELSDGRWMLLTERRTGDGGIALVQTDITEMKRAEAIIATSEERLQTILASSPFGAGVSRIDDGTILYINERAAARVGMRPDDIVGTTVAGNWVDPRDRERFREILRRDGRVEGTEIQLKRADGSRYWSLLSWERVPLFGEDTVVFWSYDISELKEAQENMRLAKESADAANRAKSEFLSNMSHELRTPMNAILGFSQILESDPDRPLDEVQRASNRHILKAGEHLLVLINEVLDLVRVESGDLSLSIEDVVPTKVIESCVTLARSLADRRGINVSDRTEGRDLPTISADFTRCKQVLLNLLSNAVKYNRPGGRIVVDAEQTGDGMLRLSVADTGPGIAEQHLEEVFEPFTRLKTVSHDDTEGTGIGLTITKRLVELMGGRIGLQSALGQGSLFWIELPLAKSDGAAPKPTAAPAAPAVVDETPAAAPAARTMLYVEDNPASVLLMERIIQRVGHLDLLSAHTAELGLEIAEARRPDLIVMDVNLPGMSGIEAMVRLRANPDTREIPVIGLSANAMPSDIKHGLAAGFRHYLTKPIRIGEVLAAIDAVTQGEAESP